ncbi:MAG: type II secretion system protein N [Thiolinea sp.]
MQKLKQQQLFDRVFEKLPDHVTLLLIILSGFLLARLTWMMFPSDPSLTAPLVNEQENTGVSVIQAHARSTDLGKEIASYHLLGIYTQPKPIPVAIPAPEVIEVPPPPPPKPRTPLNLVGVYALVGKNGIAVIDVNGQQQVIGIGEQIGDSDAVLSQVYPNRVEVSWNGEIETLHMPNIDRSALGAIQIPPEQQPLPEPEQQFQYEAQPDTISSEPVNSDTIQNQSIPTQPDLNVDPSSIIPPLPIPESNDNILLQQGELIPSPRMINSNQQVSNRQEPPYYG